ncbi:MAG: TonB family protein [Veillonella sp.]|uniref:energy transducer TonB n=1 Tax=Veillonella sp. TaxID=1926307 RepID=UPI00291220AC|nr:TonB family protein [Veillonella sp.]MDU5764045.1 TonB family protein [Veillonella sp.]
MSNVLRCVALTALIMSMSAAVSLAATPYEAPKAVSTPGFDSGVLHGYAGDAGDATVVNVNFTINTDGSVSHVELQGTTGSSDADASIVNTISTWKFTPATDSNGNPVEASKTEYINLRN